jgi:uncharacterized SAM-binding protein YcdF (DUF218 family)
MKLARSCTVGCLIAAMAAGIGVILLAAVFLAYVADWLRGDSRPQQADAIVVLAGTPERALYAADLYKAGYAKKVLVSIPVRESSLRLLDDLDIPFPRTEEIYGRILARSGVPAANVSYFGKGSASTYEEAKALSALSRGANPVLLVVTSPYHIRRAAMILRDVAGDATAQIIVVGTPYEPFPQQWWRSQDAARNVLLELAKITFYQSGGKFEAAESTEK